MAEDNAIIDASRVYCTSAQLKRVGRAVAISLEDATLPGNAKHKHMTVLYRGGRRWSKEELATMGAAAAQWKREHNGHEAAPTTFTLAEWGPASAAINGDLKALCLALRARFGAMTSDAQRPPHVELFRGDLKRRRAKSAKAVKTCLVCGAEGHFKRDCPHRAETRRPKSSNASKAANKAAKQKAQLSAMLSRLRVVRARKEREAAMLREHETKMAALLGAADALDAGALSAATKEIARSFKAGKRRFKLGLKAERDADKARRKEAKRERKRQKVERKAALKRARCSALPRSRAEIGGAAVLRVHVDGYNAMGADKLCRKAMRSRRSRWARARMARLLQRRFVDAFDAQQRGFGVDVTLWFDGKAHKGDGADTASAAKDSRVAIAFSANVDDALLSLLSANDKAQNRSVFVVSSDKALALRLDAVGVRVMKSGAFYKQHLKGKGGDEDEEQLPEAMDTDEDGDAKESEERKDCDAGDFFVVSQKMAQALREDTESGDEGCADASPDVDALQTEGADHFYASPRNPCDDGEEDFEFTQIFGEQMDVEFE